MFSKNGFSALFLLLVFISGLSFLASDGLLPGGHVSLPEVQLDIKGQPFSLQLAVNPEEQQLGLKGVSPEILSPGPQGERKGMLFVYPDSWILSFTMDDVDMPLDLLIVSSKGLLLHAETMQVKLKKTYTWPVPAKYALELPSGSIEYLNLQPGDVVIAREKMRELDARCQRH